MNFCSYSCLREGLVSSEDRNMNQYYPWQICIFKIVFKILNEALSLKKCMNEY